MRLVDNWKAFWRMWSIRLNAIGLAILAWVQIDPVSVMMVWNMMPIDVRRALPENFMTIAGLSLFSLSMMARLVRQEKVSGGK
jgi:hypothetical protein